MVGFTVCGFFEVESTDLHIDQNASLYQWSTTKQTNSSDDVCRDRAECVIISIKTRVKPTSVASQAKVVFDWIPISGKQKEMEIGLVAIVS